MKPWTVNGTNGVLVSSVRGGHDLFGPHPPISQLTSGLVKYASFSRDEFAAMGMDLEGSARFTEEYGGGYIGFLEISHKMHVSTFPCSYCYRPTTELTDG